MTKIFSKKSFLFSWILFTLLTCVHAQAYANDRNSIEILSLEQVTTGPYSVGDLVTFKVGYRDSTKIGANLIVLKGAGAKNICLSQDAQAFTSPQIWNREIDPPIDHPIHGITWQSVQGFDTYGREFELISGFVVPCKIDNESGLKSLSVLNYKNVRGFISSSQNENHNAMLNGLKIEVKQTDLLFQANELTTLKKSDKISLLNIPKNPKVGKSYALPRLTQNGVPVFWFADALGSCSVSYNTFLGDIGGNLNIAKPGKCFVYSATMPNGVYNSPIFLAKVKFKLLNEDSSIKNFGIYIVKK